MSSSKPHVVARASMSAEDGKQPRFCSLAWHPQSNLLAVMDHEGRLGMWQDPVPSELVGPAVTVDTAAKQAMSESGERGRAALYAGKKHGGTA